MIRVAVGMSGGIDSSVTALLLKESGFDVIGITMAIWNDKYRNEKKGVLSNACFGPDESEDINDARQVCDMLNIPYHVIDCAEEYEKLVLQDFRNAYTAGATPNPCIRCNHTMKFGILPERAEKIGVNFDYFATGHYVRKRIDSVSGRAFLMRGCDERKDQSYFLYRLSSRQLNKSLFPLGALRKEDVKKIAEKHNLPVCGRKESQDFYSGGYTELLGMEDKTGLITDLSGKELGKHNGYWHFTPGQRKGLRVSGSEPFYVLFVDAENNRIVIGSKNDMFTDSFKIKKCVWHDALNKKDEIECSVKIRYSRTEYPAKVFVCADNRAEVNFYTPQQTVIPPGQSAVFYDGDIVLGGGIIE
jgi:tRNA-specific 2-thiouridylase